MKLQNSKGEREATKVLLQDVVITGSDHSVGAAALPAESSASVRTIMIGQGFEL